MAKVFIFGLDGATFDLIRPWAAEGKLPNFAKLLEDGVSAPLESVPSMRSPAAWSSMMTGQNPGKHGLYEFYEPTFPGAYDVKFINGGSRRSKSIFGLLSEHGKRVGAINVPMTYPAEKVNGFMLAGLDAPSPESPGFCHPPELVSQLEQKFGTYILEPGLTGCIVGGQPELGAKKLQEELVQKEKITRHLMQSEPWDLFMVVFRSLDAVQHCYWKYMDPQHPHYDSEEAAKHGSTIFDAYQQLDRSLGMVRESLDDDTVLLLMSDHGFGRKHPGNSQLNHWLAQNGFLKFKGTATADAKTPWAIRALGNIYRQLVSRTPRGFKQKLANWLPGLRNRLQTRLIYSNIDWSQTQAFADSLFACIRLNVKGREPAGIVEPGEQYQSVVEQIRTKLMDCRDSVSGNKIVEAVFHRDEIYEGDHVELAPDLLIRWKEDELVHGIDLPPEVAEAVAKSGTMIPGEDPRIISGDHLLHGVFAMVGPSVKAGTQLEEARLIDLAPTVLSLLGVPVPDDMDGRVLQDAFADELDVNYAAAVAGQGSNSPTAYSEDDQAEIQKRLRDLGYIE